MLGLGVRECLEAAREELSTIQQEELLSAARFGKCFLDGGIAYHQNGETGETNWGNDAAMSEPAAETTAEPTGETGETGETEETGKGIVEQFQEASRFLRVLNTMRDPKVIFGDNRGYR